MKTGTNSAPWVLVAGGFHRAGGMDKANLALAEILLERGVPIHVVAHSVDEKLSSHPGVEVHIVAPPLGSFAIGEQVLDFTGRRVARSVTARFPGATVLVNGGNCIWPGVNWVHYVHHAWTDPTEGTPLWFQAKCWLHRQIARTRERAALQRAKLVVTNSEMTRRQVLDFFGLDPARVVNVYLGGEGDWTPITPAEREAAIRLFGLRPGHRTAVFVGGLGWDQRKGFDALYQVWSRLCRRDDWDVDLLVAGGGSALEHWRNEVAKAGLAERIRILGFVRNVPDLLASADLLISPVRYEAYGLNVQEAICRGVPAMVSRSAGVAERYPEALTPLLLDNPDDIDRFTESVLAWRASIDRWPPLFGALGDSLRGYGWPEMAHVIVDLVEERMRGRVAAGARA